MTRLRLVLNAVAYQCVWCACVLSAAAQRPMIGIVVALVALAWHLHCASAPGRELRLIAIAATLGAAFETLLVASGWVRMDSTVLIGGYTPLWMVALWATFATTLNVSLRTLRPHFALGAALAGVGAPIAYLAGSRLGALQWVHAGPALLVIACAWGVSMPLLLKSAIRYDGFIAT